MPDGEVGEAIFKKYFPTEDWELKYFALTGEVKAVSDYSRLSFFEVVNLPYSCYLLLKKDSWINSLKKSEAGSEFLKAIFRLNTTEADLKKLREKIK